MTLRKSLWLLACAGSALGVAHVAQAQASVAQTAPASDVCSAALPVAWPEPGTRIERAATVPAGTVSGLALPAHCEVFGIMHAHKGVDGQDYAIRFHMRLPEGWNGKFFFQGGGGSNGEIGDAYGRIASGPTGFPPALARGYAVVSQDSGHSNALNSNPRRGGPTAFGFDPQARSEYGHASLAPVARAAKAVIAAYYHRAPARSYFVGCSKGGEEGMVFAQQHPDIFNGIVAGAPGFALPRAAVEEAAEVQRLARLVAGPDGKVAFPDLHTALTDGDLALVGAAVIEACDGLDGLKDGIVSNPAACTTARVRPFLAAKVCHPGQTACLAPAKLAALYDVMAGAHWRDGSRVYADWAWDPGIAGAGWRIWKLGSADGHVPALNVVLGGASLFTVFTVPPKEVPGDPQGLLDAQRAFDVPVDGKRIYATGDGFTSSPWQDVSAHSADLSAFAARGGKLIVPHGVADPVFSIHDTLAWWQEVDRKARGHAADFARVFPVPGMNHCGGGNATDQYDALAALEDWVERGHAPDAIPAHANAQTPWPQRQRPLCAWPTYARYKGHGDIDASDSFVCVAPRRD